MANVTFLVMWYYLALDCAFSDRKRPWPWAFFQGLRQEKDQISSQIGLRSPPKVHTLSVTQLVCKQVTVISMALHQYLLTRLIMFKKPGLSHSVNTPQYSVFLFPPKPDIDLKPFHNMLPFSKWTRIHLHSQLLPSYLFLSNFFCT